MKPRKVFMFDIGDCLDIGGERKGDKGFLIPTREVFTSLRDKGYWCGFASGVYFWVGHQIANRNRLTIDFAFKKEDIIYFVGSVEIMYGPGTIFYMIGEDESDKMFADIANQACPSKVIYYSPREFYKRFKQGEF